MPRMVWNTKTQAPSVADPVPDISDMLDLEQFYLIAGIQYFSKVGSAFRKTQTNFYCLCIKIHRSNIFKVSSVISASSLPLPTMRPIQPRQPSEVTPIASYPRKVTPRYEENAGGTTLSQLYVGQGRTILSPISGAR